MTLPMEVVANIRRLHFAEHWKVGTIATQLGVHHDAVECTLGGIEARELDATDAQDEGRGDSLFVLLAFSNWCARSQLTVDGGVNVHNACCCCRVQRSTTQKERHSSREAPWVQHRNKR